MLERSSAKVGFGNQKTGKTHSKGFATAQNNGKCNSLANNTKRHLEQADKTTENATVALAVVNNRHARKKNVYPIVAEYYRQKSRSFVVKKTGCVAAQQKK